MTIRSYDRGDAASVAALSNLVELHAGGHPSYTATGVDSYVSTLVRDAELDTRLAWSDGVLVGVACVPSPPAGGHVVRLFGGVHPRWRGQGLGRRLLDWQLTRAEQIRAAAAPQATWRTQAGIMVADEQAARLFRRFGMEPARYWFDMVAPIAAAPGEPIVPLPDGFRVARYDPQHAAPLHAAHMEAFADHWGFQQRGYPEWAAVSVGSSEFRPDCSLLAFADDEIAGYILCYEDGDPDRLYVGQVGVRQPWRRRGLAGAMLARVLRAGAAAGKTTAGLAVDAGHRDGAIGVYERAGFSVTARAVTYTTLLTPSTRADQGVTDVS